MKSKLKMSALLMVMLMLVCLSAGCANNTTGGETTAPDGEAKSYTIGYEQMKATLPFASTMRVGANDAIAEIEAADGVKIELICTDSGSANDMSSVQLRNLEDLYSQGVDALLVFPADSAICGEAVASIYNANNIPVVVTDIGITGGECVSFITTDNYYGGSMAAELMASKLDAGAKVAAFNNALGRENATARVNGFLETAKEKGLAPMEQIGVQEGTMEYIKACTEDLLVSDPDVKGIFVIGAQQAAGAVSAIEEQGADCIVVNFDTDTTAYEMNKDGRIAGSCLQDPYTFGYNGIYQVYYALTGQTDKIESKINCETMLMTKDNIAEFDSEPQIKFILGK